MLADVEEESCMTETKVAGLGWSVFPSTDASFHSRRVVTRHPCPPQEARALPSPDSEEVRTTNDFLYAAAFVNMANQTELNSLMLNATWRCCVTRRADPPHRRSL